MLTHQVWLKLDHPVFEAHKLEARFATGRALEVSFVITLGRRQAFSDRHGPFTGVHGLVCMAVAGANMVFTLPELAAPKHTSHCVHRAGEAGVITVQVILLQHPLKGRHWHSVIGGLQVSGNKSDQAGVRDVWLCTTCSRNKSVLLWQ